MLRAGRRPNDVGLVLHVSSGLVLRWARDAGVAVSRAGGGRGAKAARWAAKNGASYAEAGDRFGVTLSAVQAAAVKMGQSAPGKGIPANGAAKRRAKEI